MNDQIFSIPNIAPIDGTIVNVDSMDGTIIDVDPTDEILMVQTIAHEIPVSMDVGLLKLDDSEQFRTRWNEIQGRFVDEPRSAVQQADTLVSEVIEKITRMFASEHSLLEGQWNQGNEVSTEELRKALQHYRSFFNRLVLKTESK
jgi:hypothetical protein